MPNPVGLGCSGSMSPVGPGAESQHYGILPKKGKRTDERRGNESIPHRTGTRRTDERKTDRCICSLVVLDKLLVVANWARRERHATALAEAFDGVELICRHL
jgi:hypothetical protein